MECSNLHEELKGEEMAVECKCMSIEGSAAEESLEAKLHYLQR